jgi:hypothetical protein
MSDWWEEEVTEKEMVEPVRRKGFGLSIKYTTILLMFMVVLIFVGGICIGLLLQW